jgi:hypothetical protein
VYKSYAVFFRLTALKKLERPLAFLRFFALPDEKIHRNLYKLLGDTGYYAP